MGLATTVGVAGFSVGPLAPLKANTSLASSEVVKDICQLLFGGLSGIRRLNQDPVYLVRSVSNAFLMIGVTFLMSS